MKDYYLAKFRVLVDGQAICIETVSGLKYDPNIAKATEEGRVRERNPDKKIATVLISKTDMDLEEYKIAKDGYPPWLGGNQE